MLFCDCSFLSRIRLFTLLAGICFPYLPAFANSFAIHEQTIGYSAQKRPIVVRQLTLNQQKSDTSEKAVRIYIQSGLHGDETEAVEFLKWLATRLEKGKSPINYLSKKQVIIDILPIANPDGFHAKSRLNFNQVNLNRNFAVFFGLSREYPGQKAFSERETYAIKNYINKHTYNLAIDIHGFINWIVIPSTPTFAKKHNLQVSRRQELNYKKLNQTIIKNKAILRHYSVKTAGALGDGGAFEDWMFWNQNIPAFCLEIKNRARYFEDYRSMLSFSEEGRMYDEFLRYELFLKRIIEKMTLAPKDKNLLSFE